MSVPVTFAHPAVLIPLARTPLPFAALAAGSMVPDLPLFAPWLPFTYAQTHAPVGVVTIDVLTGLVAWAAWWLVRPPLTDAAPSIVRDRIRGQARARRSWIVLGPLAGAIGAASHVLWDEFTHPGRWGERHLSWLATERAGIAGVSWAQYASGVLGLLVLTAAALVALRRADPRPRPRAWSAAPAVVLGIPVAAVIVAAVPVLLRGGTLRGLAFDVITRGGAAGTGALLVASAVWWARTRTRPPRAVAGWSTEVE